MRWLRLSHAWVQICQVIVKQLVRSLLFGGLLQRQPLHGVKKRGGRRSHAIGVGGFSDARIVSNGQRYAPVLLTFLHKLEGRLLELQIFLPT